MNETSIAHVRKIGKGLRKKISQIPKAFRGKENAPGWDALADTE